MIEFYRLRGLNQAKKLVGKAAALTENKRLLRGAETSRSKMFRFK